MSAVHLPMEPLAPGGCARCGGGNSLEARFCQHCGTPLGAGELIDRETDGGEEGWFDPPGSLGAAAPIVTALVCEVTTPASLDEMREILGRHGGSVEDLPGETMALAAVFGPEPNEGEGPIRAARAATEVRETLSGRAVSLRAGIGTADVLGEGPGAEDLWRQRAIDLATRLQRMADPGDILVAEGTYLRIGGAAELAPPGRHPRPADELPSGPLRLLEVGPDPATITLGDPPLMGRDGERARIRSALDRAQEERRAVLVRIEGEPGVGATTLAEAALAELATDGSTSVALVRCAATSELGGAEALARVLETFLGVTSTTPAGLVRSALEDLLRSDPDAGPAAERLGPALGLDGEAEPGETAWALGRLLRAAAGERSLAILLDDADRAGPWFLDLVAQAVEEAAAPIAVVATGSPGSWSPRWDRGAVERLRLGPLDRAAVDALAASLLLNPEVDGDLLERLSDAAMGDPFRLEQLAAAMVDRGELRFEHRRWVALGAVADERSLEGGDLTTLVGARIDDLDRNDRVALGLVAVVGDGAPLEMLRAVSVEEDAATIDGRLTALAIRRFLRADRSAEEETFAFAHDAIRGAVTNAIVPEARGEDHERCARWLEERCGGRLPRHAVAIAAHLASAALMGRETGRSGGDLARRASGLLASAAELLTTIGDGAGAVAALRWAGDLLDDRDPTRPEIVLRTAAALTADGRGHEAEGVLTQATRAAREAGDAAIEARARLHKSVLQLGTGHSERLEAVREAAAHAEAACRRPADEAGLAEAWSARALVHRRWGHWAAAADDAGRAAEHAERARRILEATDCWLILAEALEDGPAPVAESVERCRAVLARARGRRRLVREASGVLAILLARGGSLEEATELAAVAREAAEGSQPALGRALHRAARVEALAGRTDRAEELLWQALDAAVRAGDDGLEAAIGATLAHVTIELGRAQEALPLLDEAARTADLDDVATQVAWRSARARALIALGQPEAADGLARDAVRLAEQTDLMGLRAGALLALAEVLRAADRPDEAAPFARRALRSLERRGAEVPAQQARVFLGSLGRPAGSWATGSAEADDASPGSSDPTGVLPGVPTAPELAPEVATEVAPEASERRNAPASEGRWWSFSRG